MQQWIIHEVFPELGPEHLEPLLESYLRIWNNPENLRFLSFTQIPFDESMVKSWLSSRAREGVHYFSAASVGETGGIAVVKLDRIQGCELMGIGVDPKWKRHGVGTALIQHVVSFAGDHGFRSLDAFVFADNVRMLRILLSLGFIPVGMEHHRRPDGADLLRMKREL